MFSNYLKIAVRNLLRRKGYSFINIAGLSIGLTCCLLIYQYVAYENSFDQFNTHFPNLYRVVEASQKTGVTRALDGYALGPALKAEVPGVERFTRVHPDYDDPVVSSTERPDKAFQERHVLYVDASFLKMFSYPLVEGNPDKALESGTVLLSETTAKKYFGTDDPIGKALHVTGWISGVFRVNGVFRDVPVNSHLQFDVLLPMVDLLSKSGYNDPTQRWSWSNFMTYVQMRPGLDLAEVDRKFTNVVMTHRKADFEQTKTVLHLHAQPLADVYLHDGIEAPRVLTGNYRTVYFFLLIGFVTLLIALANYVNLATARALDRAREVGIRKVVGAERRQLVLQFITESALTNLSALLLALMFSELLRPVLNNLASTSLPPDFWIHPMFWLSVGGVFVAGTTLAGLYPALVLSSFHPISVLKGKGRSSFLRLRLRQGLVVFQFAASIVLIAGTTIVYEQLDYVRHMNLGISLHQILAVQGPSVLPKGGQQAQMMKTLMSQLRQIPAIEEMATSSALPGEGFNWYTAHMRRTIADPATGVRGAMALVDTGFAHLFGLTIIAGRGFDGMTPPSEDETPYQVVANETAIQKMDFNSPAEAIDQMVSLGGVPCRVVGVFKDFSWSSAHEQREAALFALTGAGDKLAMKVSTANLGQTISSVGKIYKSLFPGNPFEYHFVDEKFDEQYRSDERFGTLFGVFASLAILIACLGLLGLAAFTAQQRTKEIGVRKVLGASVPGLVGLLTREFIVLVLLADLAAWPIAYVIMNQWLAGFAYKINIGVSSFLFAGSVSLVIAFLTVSYQAIKASTTNPVEALRYE